MKKKAIALVLACVMCVGIGIAGTLAWLTAETPAVTNTFTAGDINIQLTETGTTDNAKNYDFVPGASLRKDPKVTVKANSEPCYLFIKVDETNNTYTGLTGKIINWDVIDSSEEATTTGATTAWTKLTGVTGVDNVWYIKITSKTVSDVTYPVLTGNQVTVNEDVTKVMINGTTETVGIETNKPVLTFTAYASQLMNNGVEFSPAQAWDNAQPTV